MAVKTRIARWVCVKVASEKLASQRRVTVARINAFAGAKAGEISFQRVMLFRAAEWKTGCAKIRGLMSSCAGRPQSTRASPAPPQLYLK